MEVPIKGLDQKERFSFVCNFFVQTDFAQWLTDTNFENVKQIINI